MALVNVYSARIQDHTGDVKTMALYFPATTTLAQITAFSDAFLAALDPVIDGVVAEAAVTLSIPVPAALKDVAVVGNTVHEGALLRFDCTNSNYCLSAFVPSWENAGFTGNAVSAAGDYGNLEGIIVAGSGGAIPTDRDGNDLVTFTGGDRTFRK
jgi:hypothetical protein